MIKRDGCPKGKVALGNTCITAHHVALLHQAVDFAIKNAKRIEEITNEADAIREYRHIANILEKEHTIAIGFLKPSDVYG